MNPVARIRHGDGEVHIDVRGLPPPQPLVEILHLIASVPFGTTVIVHHDREPALLYAELAQAGWLADRIPGAPGEVCLRLTRST